MPESVLLGTTRKLHWLLVLLQVGVGLAVVIIPAVHLSGVSWQETIAGVDNGSNSTSVAGSNLINGTTCLMGRVEGYSLCTYAYVVGGASIGATLIVSVTKGLTCGCCGTEMLGLFDMIFHGAAIVWWTVAAVIFSKHGADANNDSLPLTQWRNTEIVLSWAGAALFGGSLTLSTITAFACPCYCCTEWNTPGSGPDRSILYRSKQDQDKAAGAKARLTELAKSHVKSGGASSYTEQFLRL